MKNKQENNHKQDNVVSELSQDLLDMGSDLTLKAKQGKIDPWNIDIADIADKYMLQIAESKSNNLRTNGRALFSLQQNSFRLPRN